MSSLPQPFRVSSSCEWTHDLARARTGLTEDERSRTIFADKVSVAAFMSKVVASPRLT